MPGNWQYHADGVETALTVNHRLDGSVSSVRLQLDSFKVRTWTEDEIDENPHAPEVHYDQKEDVYQQYSDGSNATMVFTVEGGVAKVESIEPKDQDSVEPRHMMLLPAAERVLIQLKDVEDVENAIEPFATEYHNAGEITIDKLDL